ncbi:hypothetical protein LshimejAT787_0705630 [Lyophyllum shimeji]|uniref:Uncharacterized protein n=1 Tax=Lyophyllum shimeji TaxID=47721 RepID=A0A9P3PR43_LYOSH|nr:hypothetical protein LshimejAT787_0705630 [Lyophyllum shimeji]
MCPYCSANTPLHRSGPPDLRPLSALRLTEQEWAEYRRANKPDDTYKRFGENAGTKLRVVGFNEDTKSVLRASNTDGNDYIEVGWSAMDSLLWIGQRIEDKIRVALHHWVLATSDGVIFKTFGELVCTSPAFRTQDQVVLTLLVPSDLSEFVASHMKEHAWNRLLAGKAMSSDALDKATAEFHLIDPKPSRHWAAYLAQRTADSKHLTDDLSAYSGEDLPLAYEKIESSIDEVLSGTDLGEMEAVVHDCVIPLSPDFSDDGWGNISGAEVLTRIYSPTLPSAVDIYLEYHYRTRYSSVEFFCNIYYRAHPKISKELKRTVPQNERKLNGFKRMLQMGLADMPPGRRWRAVDERCFDISPMEVQSLHRLLFGERSKMDVKKAEDEETNEPDADTPLPDRISLADMMELFLASVGIVYTTAREAGDDDEFSMGEMTWEGLRGSERWMGRNLRRVCEIDPLEGDDKESEEEGIDDEEDDYDDEDEDEDYGPRGDPGCRHQ